ncbi:putative toxin-antitoxin system toxin component, PIN family [Pseudothauera rhizosphaerae]|uniref:Putative toxin-antitoxin system toxin component, PIN family n=1 Tax=Pseudothauera rhizosphaerae TaxID=2565932 RepID=A0A4S4ADW3_9RHOO|nr:putative toxin-antitoxin system toxin component, PIN family [Pseudothauera rhizosphaerae]THF57197.1 putative toxin-antitoxin system toxin component, PIN family [Pseudothauera rhizosphaerae]
MIESVLWVLDTNVLVSRLLAPRGIAARAVDHALSRGTLLMSEATLAELVLVLGHPKFDPYVTREERQRFIALLGGVARTVPINRRFRACRDPKDDKFLDVAWNGGAKAIVTGDGDLLALDPFHDIRVVAPADFLALP